MNNIIEEMLAKAKSMQELCKSQFCLEDTILDIEYIKGHPTEKDYIWMLQADGTHLVNLGTKVWQSHIYILFGYNYKQKTLYHITKDRMERITNIEAMGIIFEKSNIY